MAKIILQLGDDVSTDLIYPGKFMATILPAETGSYLFYDFQEFNKDLNSGKFSAGSIIVAGKNFGCGSSREQAVSALKYWDFVVFAQSFAPIFLRNALNLGLKIVQTDTVSLNEGDEIVFLADGIVEIRSGKKFPLRPFARQQQEIIDAGGLIAFVKKEILRQS